MYEIYGKKFKMIDEMMTGVQWDTCRPIAKRYENAITANKGYFSILDLSSDDYCKLLAAILYENEWSKENMKANELWFQDHFPNSSVLQQVVADFFEQFPSLSTESALLFRAKNRIMEILLEKQVEGMDITGLLNKLQSTPVE